MKIEFTFNSRWIGLVHQYGRRFFVLEHQYGRLDITSKRSIVLKTIWFLLRCSFLLQCQSKGNFTSTLKAGKMNYDQKLKGEPDPATHFILKYKNKRDLTFRCF